MAGNQLSSEVAEDKLAEALGSNSFNPLSKTEDTKELLNGFLSEDTSIEVLAEGLTGDFLNLKSGELFGTAILIKGVQVVLDVILDNLLVVSHGAVAMVALPLVVVLLFIIVLSLAAWLEVDGVNSKVAGLRGPVVTAASKMALIIKVLGHVDVEVFKLLLRDGKDLGQADMLEAFPTPRGGETTIVRVERVILDLLGEQGVVGGFALVTNFVSSPPGVEHGGQEWVINVATGLTIEVDGKGDHFSDYAVAKGHVHLGVVVISVKGVLRR